MIVGWKKQGIYAIRCTVNGYRYIGSSVNIGNRFYGHRCELRHGLQSSKHFQNSWDKYGAEAFEWIVLEEVVDAKDLVPREQVYIDAEPLLFNANKLAGRPVPRRGFHLSPEHKEKISKANIGKTHGRPGGWKHKPETIELYRQQRRGKKRTKVYKITEKGLAGWAAGGAKRRGHKESEETKNKKRIAMLKRRAVA